MCVKTLSRSIKSVMVLTAIHFSFLEIRNSKEKVTYLHDEMGSQLINALENCSKHVFVPDTTSLSQPKLLKVTKIPKDKHMPP
jgi:hypothetical protein